MAAKVGTKGRIVVEVLTLAGGQYRVKSNVVLSDFRQAFSLKSIIDSFATSAQRLNGARKNMG
jgi:hypothetical protein